MNKTPLQRRSFLVTCWQEQESVGGEIYWRFRLEAASFSEHRLYSDLETLTAAIRIELEQIDKEKGKEE